MENMISEPGAIPILNSNCFAGRNGYTPKFIILHGTAGGSSAQNIAAYFQGTQNSNNPVSANYVVDREGVVVQCNNESDGAWANGPITGPAGVGGDGIHHDAWWDSGINPNLLTISIELVKPSDDNSDVITQAQQDACFVLVRDICQRWSIPARAADANGGITGHFSMDPVNRSRCPGTFPWNELWAFLQGGNSMAGIPQGWHDDGQTLTAPNGIQVIQGFRDWVLANSWDAGNWPLMSVQALNPVEIGNPSLGAGTVQPFRTSVLAWTKTRGVYLMWIGQEYTALYLKAHDTLTQLTNVQAQVKALQAQIAQSQPADPQIADLKNRLSETAALAAQLATISKI